MEPMDREARRAIEAIVMVADEPAEPTMLAQLIEVPVERIDALCREIADSYDAEGRGFALVKIAGGWRFESRAELAPYVERFVLAGQSTRLSAAALETLAIVAYKQPISRAQIGAIRGVSVDGVLRTLQQRGYIDEVGRDEGPGQATLFGTTRLFLERLGIDSLQHLPPLGAFVPDATVVEALEDGLRLPVDPEPEHPERPESDPERELDDEGAPARDPERELGDDAAPASDPEREPEPEPIPGPASLGGERLDALDVLDLLDDTADDGA
ncbi:MAG TPA: SMC-Scp complex subunit ScpB [Microthrixaceae bacterium]|nr:SMC-Scp complex subunit ScpB [Microthrixaceae bacterium]HMT24422.1 SMC-Scp complex subunit ScpB [Microthrixaceae bacterium]HMT60796.1 SMC-Scp complex subunit ScpB [Microthrixaceae bacterium]